MNSSHNIAEPHDHAFLQQLLNSTPARIGVWRAGVRPMTADLLRFRADHAAAQDAVLGTVSEEHLAELNLPVLQTMVGSKEEYLTRPDLGRKLSAAGKDYLRLNTMGKRQVQVIVSDGLSARAIEANAREFLSAFLQGLNYYQITYHQPAFVKYGRVRLLEDVATAVDADVYVIVVGERPGLLSAKSMSAYFVYKPTLHSTDADYLVLSNIHNGGTPAVEAAAQTARLVSEVIRAGVCGIAYKQMIARQEG